MALSRKQMFAPAQGRGRLRQPGPVRLIPAPDAPVRLHQDDDAEPVAVTVVIACYNGATTLDETLGGLAEQDWDKPWEILLMDNGSTDQSVALFEAFARAHPALKMRVIDASARPGQQYAMNLGIAEARAPAVIFCDADDVPGEGWLEAMGKALAEHPLVAARMDFERLNNSSWVARSRSGFQDDQLERLAFMPDLVHSGGGALGLQTAIVDRVGGFDPDFTYLMDTEFCIRAQLAGFPITLVPEAKMHIRARDSLPDLFHQSYNWGRYEMKLVSRYRYQGISFAGGWRRYLRSWRQVLHYHLRKGLKPTPATMLNAAWLRSGVGRLTGNLVGMILYRTGPYGRPSTKAAE